MHPRLVSPSLVSVSNPLRPACIEPLSIMLPPIYPQPLPRHAIGSNRKGRGNLGTNSESNLETPNPADSALVRTPVDVIIDVLGPDIVSLDAAFRRAVSSQPRPSLRTGLGSYGKRASEEVNMSEMRGNELESAPWCFSDRRVAKANKMSFVQSVLRGDSIARSKDMSRRKVSVPRVSLPRTCFRVVKVERSEMSYNRYSGTPGESMGLRLLVA